MTKIDHACCFTGHRRIENSDSVPLEQTLTATIENLITEKKVQYFCTGGALGFDTLCAKTVLKLKEKYPHISLILFLPCKNQTEKWSQRDIDTYNEILEKADNHIYVSDSYTKDCMLKRNRKMVDCTNFCVSYLRRAFGGSAYTVNYAKSMGREIISL